MKHSQLQKIQDSLYEMALVFKALCENNGLCYYMTYGTLLGAVRHGNFIPWDDDMDFVMPRWDYEEFRKIAPKEIDRLSNGRFAIRDFSIDGNKYTKMWLRIDDKTTTVHIKRNETTKNDYKGGVWLDIQPLDGTFETRILQQAHLWLVNKMLVLRWYTACRDPKKSKKTYNKLLLTILQFVFGGIFGYKLTHWLMGFRSYKTSKYIRQIGYPGKEIVTKEHFGVPTKISFRDTEFFAPQKYHEFLEYIYGDYMSPKREEGHYTCGEVEIGKSYV